MSTTTYLQLCQLTQRACGISGNPIVSVDNQKGMLQNLTTWVADADIAVQREAINWDFLYKTDFFVNTVQGSSEYQQPSDLGDWDRSTFYLDRTTNNNLRLTEMAYRRWFNYESVGVQQENQPCNFILPPSKNPIVHPVPDSVYRLTANYWRTPLRMVANDDTSLIPETYIRVIIARAKMYYGIDQEADEVYAEAVTEYNNVLSELKSNQLPGWEGYRVSDNVQITVSTDGYTGGAYGDGGYPGFDSYDDNSGW